MVVGFGGRGELGDKQLVPGKITAYRRFRFMPCTVDAVADAAWREFEYDRYHASLKDDLWDPCLMATGIGPVVYNLPGEYVATCQSRSYSGYYGYTVNGNIEFIGAPRGHQAPERACTCGFWAYYEPVSIKTGSSNDWTAVAAVRVWGDVVLGEKGVRAQKMEIAGLIMPDEVRVARSYEIVKAWNDLLAKLKVPQFNTHAELLEFVPPSDVSALLPKPTPPPEMPCDLDSLGYGRISFKDLYNRITGVNGMLTMSIPSGMYYAGDPSYGVLSQPSVVVPPVFATKCCVCGYQFEARTQTDVDRLLAKHTIEAHTDFIES